ncbi:MAG: hypothetical protein WKF94_10735 [Solirubrobacteraceae bacterium]
MNALADPFKQLVERRLWPVALLLVAALIAVPLLLAKDPEATVLPSAVAGVPADQGVPESIVSLDDPARRDEARAVLGSRKDPFRPAQLKPVPTVEDSLGSASVQATADNGASASGNFSSEGGGSSPAPEPPSVPAPVDLDPAPTRTADLTREPEPTPDTTPEPTFDLYSVQVRFGDIATGELKTRNVKRLTSLPGGTNPAVLYLGLSENKQSAVFLVEAGVEVVGDGRCDPSPDSCETLVLEPGETVFLTRGERQFELDLVEIHTAKTTDEAKARKSRTAVADGGRAALRRMKSASRYRYSAASGTVRELAPAERGLRGRSAKFTSGG